MKNKYVKYLCSALLLLCWVCVPATAVRSETRQLTLEQALEIAEEQNRDIQKAREYIVWAKGKYIEERAAAFPQLTTTGSIARDRDESQKLYGPTLADPVNRQSAQIVLTQPLFTWGQISAAIRAADVGLKSADEQLRLYRQAALRDVAAAFYDVLLARELHLLSQQNLAQKKRHLAEAKKKYAEGVATDYDVLAAEVAVENARPDVIRTENQVRTTQDRLCFHLALDNDKIDALGSLVVEITPGLTYEKAVALAIKRRPDLTDMKYRIGISRELVVLASAQNKPRIDIKGAYGRNRIDQGDGQGEGAIWSAGIYLTYPLFDGLRTRGRLTQANSDLQRLKLDEAKLIDTVAIEIREAVNAVQEASEIVRSLAGTAAQADRLLAMAEKGYALGVKMRLDVEDAQLNLQQAQSNLSRARRDYLVARINLDWVTGILGEERSHYRKP